MQVWHSPTLEREVSPFVLHRTYGGCSDVVMCLRWSGDSSVLLGGCKDGSSRIWTVQTVHVKYVPIVLSGHRTGVMGAYFDEVYSAEVHGAEVTTEGRDRLRRAYTISVDGSLVTWTCVYSDEKSESQDSQECTTLVHSQAASLMGSTWSASSRHYFQQHSDVTCTAYATRQNLLIVGFASGVFGVYELPSANTIHTLSISKHMIRTTTVNSTGKWLAFGCPSSQEMLVWEWLSETYVIKQRGHDHGMRCMG